MSGLEGVLSFNFSGSMGRTNFVVDPPLHVEGNRVTIDTSGLVSEVVAGTNVTVDNTDPTHPVVSAAGSSAVVESVVAGTNVTVDNTDPANPIVSASGGSGVASVVAGTGIAVDATDPVNPIVSLSTTAVGSFRQLDFTFSYTDLAAAATYTAFTPSGSDEWITLGAFIMVGSSTNWTGGNRTIIGAVSGQSASTSVFDTYSIATAALGSLGSVDRVLATSGAVYTCYKFNSSRPLSFRYQGGTTDYTAGTLRIKVNLLKVA